MTLATGRDDRHGKIRGGIGRSKDRRFAQSERNGDLLRSTVPQQDFLPHTRTDWRGEEYTVILGSLDGSMWVTHRYHAPTPTTPCSDDELSNYISPDEFGGMPITPSNIAEIWSGRVDEANAWFAELSANDPEYGGPGLVNNSEDDTPSDPSDPCADSVDGLNIFRLPRRKSTSGYKRLIRRAEARAEAARQQRIEAEIEAAREVARFEAAEVDDDDTDDYDDGLDSWMGYTVTLGLPPRRRCHGYGPDFSSSGDEVFDNELALAGMHITSRP